MKTIYKYTLDIEFKNTISVPVGSKLLSIINQNEYPVAYFLVEASETQKENINIYCRGTGQSCETVQDKEFITSLVFANGVFVWHFFKD